MQRCAPAAQRIAKRRWGRRSGLLRGAALLVEDPATLIADGDPAGTAFFQTARVAAGSWLATLTALATALACGLANTMVAQVGTSRLLYAMARDRLFFAPPPMSSTFQPTCTMAVPLE